MTKIEIIDDTVAFYSVDPKGRRSLDSAGSFCRYKGDNGTECAFQRVVENDLNEFEERPADEIMNELKPDLKFKPGYEGHNAVFWLKIQMLHDNADYWNETGLSEQGEIYVKKLKEKYS